MDHGRETCVSFVRTQGNATEVFQIAEEILNQVPPSVHDRIYLKGLLSLWSLRDADQRTTGVHLFNDPVCVECFVRKKGLERQPPYQWLHADCVVAVSG